MTFAAEEPEQILSQDARGRWRNSPSDGVEGTSSPSHMDLVTRCEKLSGSGRIKARRE